MLVRVGHDWQPVPRGSLSLDSRPTAQLAIEPWLAALATDSKRFREIAAVTAGRADAERAPADLLRPLRELAHKPTLRRLENFLAKDRDGDAGFAESVIRRAVWDLELLGPGEVPDDWLDRIKEAFAANLPDAIGRIAGCALERLRRRGGGKGRRRDHSLETYVDRIAGIFEGIAGRTITYTKTTEVHETPHIPRGLGLDYMLSALRLLDPADTPHQAAEQIDRIRKQRRRHRSSAKTRH